MATRKTTKKTKTAKKPRRSWTPEKKAEIAAYAQEHGVTAAVKRYRVLDSSVYRWMRAAKASAKANGEKQTTQRRKTARVSKSGFAQLAFAELKKENEALRQKVRRLEDREEKISKVLVDSLIEQRA